MRVISVTPAGRRRYLQALVPHLLRQQHVIDEHHWWLNTHDEADAQYVTQLAAEHPHFFKVIRKDYDPTLTIGEGIWRFFRHAAEPDTVYVRLDDDIVWFAPDAIHNLVRFRLENREPFIVSGNVVNNGVCAHALQKAGFIPQSFGEVQNFCLDGNGWACPRFARKLHELFLSELAAGRIDRWKETKISLYGTRRFSINVISWFGDDMRQVPEVLRGGADEEIFLTVTLPQRLRRPNVACGDALFTHFAFFSQRPYLEWTWPELIEHYQQIAEGRPAELGFSEKALLLLRHSTWKSGKHVRKFRERMRKRREQRERRLAA
ncbi:MAG: hypothetical protein DWQ37_15045 [Planctomycetota bacterium]|nr:MAG: hypothetical protein DWQ37_15045 [Planctomycetota bacterium]